MERLEARLAVDILVRSVLAKWEAMGREEDLRA